MTLTVAGVVSVRASEIAASVIKASRSIVPVGNNMAKMMIIIGLILTLIVTVPILLFLILFMAALIDRDRRERPDAPPPSKDDWRVM